MTISSLIFLGTGCSIYAYIYNVQAWLSTHKTASLSSWDLIARRCKPAHKHVDSSPLSGCLISMHQSGAVPCVISDQVRFSTPIESAGSADLIKTTQGEAFLLHCQRVFKNEAGVPARCPSWWLPYHREGAQNPGWSLKVGESCLLELDSPQMQASPQTWMQASPQSDCRRHSHMAQFLCLRVKLLNPIVGISKKWGAFLHWYWQQSLTGPFALTPFVPSWCGQIMTQIGSWWWTFSQTVPSFFRWTFDINISTRDCCAQQAMLWLLM